MIRRALRLCMLEQPRKDAPSRLFFFRLPDRFQVWQDTVGDIGVVYVTSGYSAMGQLLNYWMGVEEYGQYAD